METTTAKLYSLEYSRAAAYLAAGFFVLGNLALPQLCHLVRLGGPTWLPLYFFTLVGAYKFGWRVGLLTAVCSPLLHSALFGMPLVEALPAILVKSVLLALVAGWIATRFRRATLPLLAATVFVSQLLGTLGSWALSGDLPGALQELRIGIPGLLFHIFGGWAFIRFFLRR